jgi:hypothetical protein
MGRRRTVTDKIEIFVDNKLFIESDDPIQAKSEVFNWFMKTPFWQQTSMFFNYYKNVEENEDYINRKNVVETSVLEKNLFFMEDDNPYVCLRCFNPSEIVGFCADCYNSVYGLDSVEEIEIPLEEIEAHPKFVEIVSADEIYTNQIKESIEKDGMKNPIVVDEDKRILIGHHRYYIAKELGWETIRCKINKIKFNHGLFYEGKGSSLFVIRIDGELCMSTTNFNDVQPAISDFHMNNTGKTFTMECFLNIGSDIRLRNVFIPHRGDVVDPTWRDWYIRKFNKKPKIGKFS